MSFISNSSESSLRTDSDYPEEELQQHQPVPITRNPVNIRIEDLSSPDDYVSQMLAQISDEVHLNINNVPSCDISTVKSGTNSYVSGNVSFLDPEKIHEINSKLQKQIHTSLWNYKSTTRPIFWDSQGKKCGDFLMTQFSLKSEGLNSGSDEKWKRQLSKSLRKIIKLEHLKESNQSCLETQMEEMKYVETEREELTSRLSEISDNLHGIARVKRNMMKQKCECLLF